MQKSFFTSLLKFFFSLAVLGALIMIYWSSLLVEEDLKSVKSELASLQEQVEKTSRERVVVEPSTVEIAKKRNSQEDPKFENLLQEDPFYEKTLPGLLGPDFVPYGTRDLAVYGKPENLHPFSNWGHVRPWLALCNVSVARSVFGFYEKYAPYAALKVEERVSDNGETWEYWIHLRDDLYWEPLNQKWFSNQVKLNPHFLKRTQLTAHDFKLQFDLYMNPFVSETSALTYKQFYDDILEFRVVDDFTFVVKWKTYPLKNQEGKIERRPKFLAKSLTLSMSPLAGFVFRYYPDGTKIVPEDADPEAYRKNSTFAQVFQEHWAKNVIPTCGPMQFEGMSDQRILFSRNRNFFDPLACLVQKIDTSFKQSNDAIWQSFKQGSIDSYTLSPEKTLEFAAFLESPMYKEQEKAGFAIKRLDYVARQYWYIGWNQARPLFKNKKVRQAMTMAIDRKRIIRQVINGMGMEITNPTYPFSDAYDNSLRPIPFDPHEAKRLLEVEGFSDLDGDGILEKEIDGTKVKFEFALTYFVKNPTTKAISEYIATALKEIGVKVNLNGVDTADLSALFDDKNFDAYILAWGLPPPPEDLKQIWYSTGAKEKGSSNSVGFQNKEADRIIDQLTYEYNPKKRAALYHSFDRIFYDEQPYTLLYIPKVAFLYREILQNVFLPVDRQDLVPGAIVAEPDSSIFWIKKRE